MSISLPVQDQVARKVCLSEQMLLEAIDNIRGAVMICYPMGLPEWDLVRENLESKEDLSGTSVRGIILLGHALTQAARFGRLCYVTIA